PSARRGVRGELAGNHGLDDSNDRRLSLGLRIDRRRSKRMSSPDRSRIAALTHRDRRANIPPAELEPVLDERDKAPLKVAYERRNPDLDPQLVWRGKDPTDWSDIVVDAPPIYLQEQIHPKALIEDLRAGR